MNAMSAASTKFSRAYLRLEGGKKLLCWFNPTTLDRSRRADWFSEPAVGQAAPRAEYRGGREDSLSLNLLLHADDERPGSKVSEDIDELMGLVDPAITPHGRLPRPRTVQFIWGQYVSFVAVCASVDVTTELFDSDGTPLRATVKLTLNQYEPEPGQGTPKGQNPTTSTLRRAHSHTVEQGDSLQRIAFEYYKDPTRWREIAICNDIDDPLRIRPGDTMLVPIEGGP